MSSNNKPEVNLIGFIPHTERKPFDTVELTRNKYNPSAKRHYVGDYSTDTTLCNVRLDKEDIPINDTVTCGRCIKIWQIKNDR